MWTVIIWNREANQWYSMRGFSDEVQAFEKAEQWRDELPSSSISSLADPTGEIIWASIGTHPVIGWCHSPSVCWCGEHPVNHDHTLIFGSSNT